MKQTTFNTIQKAEELLQNAMNIWRQSDHSEYLDGLENDPIFSLLMCAMAYQANGIECDIENIKSDVVEEFERILSFDGTGNAIPATVAVTMNVDSSASETDVDSSAAFTVQKENQKNRIRLMPLLHTHAINAEVASVTRLDRKRWQVEFSLKQPVRSLRGWSFSIKDTHYHDLEVSLLTKDGESVRLPLIKPTDYSELPYNEEFSISTLLYNRSHAQVEGGGRHGALSSYMNWCTIDLFARENIRMYFVDWNDYPLQEKADMTTLKLVFEFSGMEDSFYLQKEKLEINTNILINAYRESLTISKSKPIARVTTYSESQEGNHKQFLYILRPLTDQVFGSIPIQIRRVAADRFNRNKLLRLVNNLLNKYHTDFYAFSDLKNKQTNNSISQIRSGLEQLYKALSDDEQFQNDGIYIMFDHTYLSMLTMDISLDVDYLCTDGSAANSLLESDRISGHGNISGMRIISTPQNGSDTIRNAATDKVINRFLLNTNNQLVTPYDIKLFCQTELQNRWNIVSEMIRSIRIGRRTLDQGTFHTYQITVDITLHNNQFMKRTFMDKIPTVEIYLQKMIEVRSANIYPVKVGIKVEGI